MTAALYALRAGKSVLLLEKSAFGGQIAESPKVENIPSIKSISGMDYASLIFDQISDLGVAFDMDDIKSVIKEDGYFTAKGEYASYEAKAVIIATGCKPRKLAIKGEETFLGKGVSYCAVCDGAFYEGKDVTVIGDGNAALSYALSLADTSRKVAVCTLFDRFFGEESAAKALLKRENVEVIHDVSATEFKGDAELRSILFKKKDGSSFELKTDGCFVAIGQLPDNSRFEGLVRLTADGFIQVDGAMATATAGIYAAGDCRDKKIRQVTTAESDGAIAALSTIAYLNKFETHS